MKKAKIFLLFILFLLLMPGITLAENLCPQNACGNSPCQDPLRTKECLDYTNCLQDATNKCGKQRVDLTSQINYMDTQIKLTTTKIYQTQNQILQLDDQIASLSGQIGRLESSLGDLSKILLGRIAETYKKGNPSPFSLLLSANGFSDLLSRLKYLRLAQAHDKKLMFAMQQTKDNYTDQKQAREDKKTQQENLRRDMEVRKRQLAQQIKDRQTLLEITRNDEKRYQSLLAQARAELIAIKGILAGQGKEIKVGSVSEGQKIASVIQGSSCNSSGTHLHFIVSQGSNTHNPFNYLRGGISYENCSGSSCGDSDGDSFNPIGSWSWPINPPIKFNQGYGKTWAVEHTWVGRVYDFHNGIDINSDSLEVKAVKAGVLYQGIYEGNCNLTYVRVDHDESDLDTLYLHVQ